MSTADRTDTASPTPESPDTLAFAARLFDTLGTPLTPSQRAELAGAVAHLAAAPPERRTLLDLGARLRDPALRAALVPLVATPADGIARLLDT